MPLQSYMSGLSAALSSAAPIAKAGIRIGDRVSGNGRRTELTNEVSILISLRLGKVESLNLRLERLNLGVLVLHAVLDKLIVEGAIVGILIIGDIASRLRNGSGDSTRVSGKCSVKVGNGETVLAAAIGKLARKLVLGGSDRVQRITTTLLLDRLRIGDGKTNNIIRFRY